MTLGFGITDLKRLAGITLLAVMFLFAPNPTAQAHGVDSAEHGIVAPLISVSEQVGSAKNSDCPGHRGMACCVAGQCASCVAVCPMAARGIDMRAPEFAPYGETRTKILASLRTRPSNPPPRLHA